MIHIEGNEVMLGCLVPKPTVVDIDHCCDSSERQYRLEYGLTRLNPSLTQHTPITPLWDWHLTQPLHATAGAQPGPSCICPTLSSVDDRLDGGAGLL